jgi:hypothetical protein
MRPNVDFRQRVRKYIAEIQPAAMPHTVAKPHTRAQCQLRLRRIDGCFRRASSSLTDRNHQV